MKTRQRTQTQSRKTEPVQTRKSPPKRQTIKAPPPADDGPPVSSSSDDDDDDSDSDSDDNKSQSPVRKRSRTHETISSAPSAPSPKRAKVAKQEWRPKTREEARDEFVFAGRAKRPQKTFGHDKLPSVYDRRSGFRDQDTATRIQGRTLKNKVGGDLGKQSKNRSINGKGKGRKRSEGDDAQEEMKEDEEEERNPNLALFDSLNDTLETPNGSFAYLKSSLANRPDTSAENNTSSIGKSNDSDGLTCPICSCPISGDLEDECRLVATQPFKKKTAFCRMHTKKKALEEWEERSYPEIDWATLDSRIASCLPALEEIITRKRHSFYRELLTKQADEDENKSTMKKYRLTVESKSLESVSTGYYGPRGAKLM